MNPGAAEPLDTLRADVRRFLARVSPPATVRQVMETDLGYDPAVWEEMAGSVGPQGLLADGDWPRLGVALEEMGRALLCAPFLSSAVLAPAAILASGDEGAQGELLPAMASGRLLATVAVADDAGGWSVDRIHTSANARGVLEGRKAYVLDGHVADVLVVPARAGDAISLFLVDAGARGMARRVVPTMDRTRKLATVEFSGTPARLLGEPGSGSAALRRVLDTGAVALAAEQVGGAQRGLELTVEHARARHQFGRPIGSFQAVKHKCADMLIAVESARSAARHAVAVAADPSSDLGLAASMAKVCCSEAYFRVAADTIQLHGALGFSWDHDAHLYFKRATSSRLLFGDPAHHRRLLAQRLGF